MRSYLGATSVSHPDASHLFDAGETRRKWAELEPASSFKDRLHLHARLVLTVTYVREEVD